MFDALLPAYAIGGGRRVRAQDIPCTNKDRGARSSPCAQSGRRMDEKRFPLTGRVDQWRGMAEKWIGIPGSPLCPGESEQRGSPLCLGLS